MLERHEFALHGLGQNRPFVASRNALESSNAASKSQLGHRFGMHGGGLLGLEMAASLREIGVAVTVVQRSSRLMDRQLDTLGSQLLLEEIVERGEIGRAHV